MNPFAFIGKMLSFFFLTDEDWKKLELKEIDQLGQDPDLEDEEAKMLRLFKIMDLRVEWGCRRTVLNNNGLVIVVGILLALLCFIIRKHGLEVVLSILPWGQ